jgi:tetratricopeptide (TPR) repeat protein
MFENKVRSNYGVHIHRTKTIYTALIIVSLSLIVIAVIFFVPRRVRSGGSDELYGLWSGGNYREAYELSKSALETKSMDPFLLTIRGYSAYQLGISQINSFDTLAYIDDCIWSLRKAVLGAAPDKGGIYYVLGKAYYYKGDGYADLAVKYLKMARDSGYTAKDIPEYLGLASAALRDYRGSVEAFSLVLNSAGGAGEEGPSDVLLLSIARSYTALGENDAAKAYLSRCIETSRNSNARIAARFLLAEIFVRAEDPEEAEGQYTAILEEAGENAEARFQLGELYNARGDTTRSRAEWRRAVRADPGHAKARARLNM